MADEERPLLPKQKAFVAEYLIDLNATQAAIRVGYSARTAGEQAARLLADVRIQDAVETGMAQRLSRVNTTADSVLHEISVLAKSSIDHFFVDDEGQVQLVDGAPDGAMGAIQSIKRKTILHYDDDGNVNNRTYDVEIRLWDKPGSLKLMGKHAGLNFSDRVEVTGKDGGPIVSKIIREIIDPSAEG